jgi:hypothetical protein
MPYIEISFEIKLYETSNAIQFIYHPINPQSMQDNIQVGLKGATSQDYNTRETYYDWTATTPGTACSRMYFSPPNVIPNEGLTYTFTPPGVCTKETFPYGYGFGTSGLLDACWSFEQVAGYQNWLITSASGNPNMYPYQGPMMAMFPSHGLTGAQARIKSPPMNFALYNFPELTFFMSQDSSYPLLRDSIIVEASTNNGTSWNFLKSFQRYSPGNPPHWEQKNVDLSQFHGYNNVVVGIRGVANNGNNILIDTIQITHFISLPNVATNSAVTTGQATARCTGTVVTNDPISADGVCWNTTGSPTISDPHTNDGSNSSFTSFVQGLNPNQTYYVRAYATNPVGTAYGNELTFTTCNVITLPYNEGFTDIANSGSWPCGWSNENPNFVTTSTGNGCSTPNYAEFYYSNSGKWVFSPGVSLFAGNHYSFSVWFKTDGYQGWQRFRATYGTKPDSTGMIQIPGALVNNPVNTSCVQLTGTFTPSSPGIYYIGLNCIDDGTPWYFTFDDITLTDITGISKNNNDIPKTYSLYQNYPNPFNPSTSIKFDLPAVRSQAGIPELPLIKGAGGMFTKLSIYDLTGKEVATLVNEKLSPGSYTVNFDGGNFASGVYFYKITAGDFTGTKKMVLMK